MAKRLTNRKLAVLILAAGKGTRMESELPKVLHKVAGQPMLYHVLKVARQLQPKKLVVVVGHRAPTVKKVFKDWPEITWVKQTRMKGTGDAVRSASRALSKFNGQVLILYGDIPGIRRTTLRRLTMVHNASKNVITLLTADLEDPTGYGRILLDAEGDVRGIIEERDADDDQSEITEINTGLGMYDSKFLFSAVKKLKDTNAQGELYLTDLVELAHAEGKGVGRLEIRDVPEILGINNREDLAGLSLHFYERKAKELFESGVTIEYPTSTHIERGVDIGADTIVGGRVSIHGPSKIGREVMIGTGCDLREIEIEKGVQLGDNVSMANAKVGEGTSIGSNTSIGN